MTITRFTRVCVHAIFQEITDSVDATPVPDTKEHRGSRLTIAPSVENLSRKGRKMSVSKAAEPVVMR